MRNDFHEERQVKERRGRAVISENLPTSKRYEEYAYVLDFLPRGRPGTRQSYQPGTLVQVVGENFFTLLEAIAKENTTLSPFDRVYVGKENRKEITYIMGRIGYEELTSTARMELPEVVEKIILNREKDFVGFFNVTRAVTPRMHSLELIPGIGKKYMWVIVNEREKRPFESFEDLQQRTNIPEPAKLLRKRVLEELSGESKYRLFTRPL